MATVFTTSAVERMLARGAFLKVRLADLATMDYDEVFYFRYPSPDPINEANDDGDWLEVLDHAADFLWVDTERGKIPSDSGTEVYVSVPEKKFMGG
jgi:hypothetical protein